MGNAGGVGWLYNVSRGGGGVLGGGGGGTKCDGPSTWMCKWKWKWKGTRGCFEQVPASPPSKTRETAVHFKDNHVLDRSVTLTTRLLLKPQQQRSPKPQISTYFNPDRSVFINLDRDVSVPQANEPVQTAASNILCLIWRIC